MINILIKADKENVENYVVSLTSFFMNNDNKVNVFCVEEKKDSYVENMLTQLVNGFKATVYFVDKEAVCFAHIENINENLEKSYHVLLAHTFLPLDIERILFLNSDVIVNDTIEEFYNQSFDDKLMLVRGQSYKKNDEKYYKVGARPEKGQFFDSRVLLINVNKFRINFDIHTEMGYLSANGGIIPTMQGVLNVLLADRVKYESSIEYNYRLSIYEAYVRDGNGLRNIKPKIICMERRDYYSIGVVTVPWELKFNKEETVKLAECGIVQSKFDLSESEMVSRSLVDLWWFYAEKTILFDKMFIKMSQIKEGILEKINKSEEQITKYRENQKILEMLMRDKSLVDYSELAQIKYRELEQYIDSVSKENAIRTMQNLFKKDCTELASKNPIKVCFVVYSSAEWQCEELYRKLAEDERFEPTLLIAIYNQGNIENVQKTYNDTCKYFQGGDYRVIYSEDIDNESEINKFDKFDILIYISPFEVLPHSINILERKINQLCVHIPYGYYLVNKEDAYYNGIYYEKAAFKLTWFYFAECKLQKHITCSYQRLGGYNVCVSGFPKLDTLINKNFVERTCLWKTTKQTCLKIIWAPHFNMINGMNGTFKENYIWLHEYAQKHKEISWIVRPHPRLPMGAVRAGVFQSTEEYYDYMEKWNRLPNACVWEGGEYYDIFATSDAMILDSVSFLAEYQFTEKPLLFLLPNEPRALNKLGEELLSVLYTARGNDFDAISKFICDLKKNEDPGKDERIKFKNEFLDYTKLHGKSATQYIYDVILSNILK